MKIFKLFPKQGGKKTAAIVVTVGAFMLTGCTVADDSSSAGAASGVEILAEHGLDALDVRELIETLDAMPLDERTETLITSVTAETVTLTDQHGHTAEVPLPGDEIYVSVAPYGAQTHDCFYHSPTGCLGELRNADVGVTVTDTATGEVIIDKDMRTFDNGFVGIWLPRGVETSILITHDDQVATSELSTVGDDAQTCVTTMQLT
ncbi:CueP family metal-binding protein [Curtobacterium sp. KT1]|uniref:CueP family metal-binding protein n=1 Tax=Curtobacterium sp. KT1 TaxID=3372858 RepID=UPI0037BF22EF